MLVKKHYILLCAWSCSNQLCLGQLKVEDKSNEIPVCEKLARRFRRFTHHSLHWSLDVTFNKDACRTRDENAAVNYSWMRKFALGLLKKDNSFKASIRRKQRKVCTNINYLAKVIGQV